MFDAYDLVISDLRPQLRLCNVAPMLMPVWLRRCRRQSSVMFNHNADGGADDGKNDEVAVAMDCFRQWCSHDAPGGCNNCVVMRL